jgi:hypothetical protein
MANSIHLVALVTMGGGVSWRSTRSHSVVGESSPLRAFAAD